MKSFHIIVLVILTIIGLETTNGQGLTVKSPPFHGGSPPMGLITSIDLQLSIPSLPKVGDVLVVTFTIKCKNDLEGSSFGPDYKVYFTSNSATITAGKEQYFTGYLKTDDIKQFKATMVINKAVPTVSINGVIEGGGRPGQSIGFVIFLIDKQTGQYGTKEEYEGKLPIEYRYDPIAGSFTCSPSQNPAPVEENRRIIKMLKQLEPALSDSEALYLHSDMYRVGIPKGAAQWDETNRRWNDSGIFEYYLKDGWLKAFREGKIEEWREKEKKKIENECKERSFNFFRGDSDNSKYFADPPADSFTKTFDGKWRFKNHKYNKTDGLLADADKEAVKGARARVLVCFECHGYYRKLTRQCTTDDTGYFSVPFTIPDACTLGKAYAIVYPAGGGTDTASPVINVSDPNQTSASYTWDPWDATLYVNRNMYCEEFYSNPYAVHFDSVYADTYPEVAQPQSGSINIYETYLHARTFMSPAPIRPLRCIWEPGYHVATGMDTLCLDTVCINGDTVFSGGSDEWDDDILLHEFGHYVMDYYARKPKSDTGIHYWHQDYLGKRGIGYGEGWAYFFSCRARVGSGLDSLIINTAKGIARDSVYLWNNIENPWLSNDFTPAQFHGGQWCEGSVAGALWDIYDSKNEVPYDSYPDYLYGVWFPDTGLADTLSMGSGEIWNVFDNYDPAGTTDTNCQNIFQFRSGWNYYEYDHAYVLNQIFLHHRILDTIPAAPTGLSARQVLDAVRLYWHMNLEPDLYGYRIFRRDSVTMGFVPWTDWAFLTEKTAPTDTTHLDNTVVKKGKYRYKLNAFDSLGNESAYSDSVSISVRGGKGDDGQSSFGLTKTMFRGIGEIEFFVPTGTKKVFVKIYDCCGRIVNKRAINIKQSTLFEIRLYDGSKKDNLPSGVYFLYLETDKKDIKVEKFVIIR